MPLIHGVTSSMIGGARQLGALRLIICKRNAPCHAQRLPFGMLVAELAFAWRVEDPLVAVGELPDVLSHTL